MPRLSNLQRALLIGRIQSGATAAAVARQFGVHVLRDDLGRDFIYWKTKYRDQYWKAVFDTAMKFLQTTYWLTLVLLVMGINW